MKKIVLLLVSLWVIDLHAQPCPEAAQIRRDVQAAYDNGLLDKALEGVKALRACDPSFDREADKWTEKVFAKIKEQKQRAEAAEKRAYAEAEKARKSKEETGRVLSQLQQNTSNYWLSEAQNAFDRDFSHRALGCLLKSQEAWPQNREANIKLDSIADYLPDWSAVTDEYVSFSLNGNLFSYFDAPTANGLNCDFVIINPDNGDTMRLKQVSKRSRFSMEVEFTSFDNSKVIYYTESDATSELVKGTINIYDKNSKKEYRFPNANLFGSWISDNSSLFAYFSCDSIKSQKSACGQLNIFDFTTGERFNLGNVGISGADWTYWISPDGSAIAYTDNNVIPNDEGYGTLKIWQRQHDRKKTIENVYVHELNYSSDSRYLMYQTGSYYNGQSHLLDLKTFEDKAAPLILIPETVYWWGGYEKVYLIDTNITRTYDAKNHTWSEKTGAPKNLFHTRQRLIKGDKIVYTILDSVLNQEQIGVYNLSSGQDTLFQQYYSEINLYNALYNANNSIMSINITIGTLNYLRIYNLETLEMIDLKDFWMAKQDDNFAPFTQKGDWAAAFSTRKEIGSFGIKDFIELCSFKDKTLTTIDSGYYFKACFTGDDTKIVYGKTESRYNSDDYFDLIIYNLVTTERIALKGYRSNKLTEQKIYSINDFWIDNKKRILFYASGPKTFTSWDLIKNKPIRTFKIAQEYEKIEIKGDTPVAQIKFRNNLYKWYNLSQPAKPLKVYIDALKKKK